MKLRLLFEVVSTLFVLASAETSEQDCSPAIAERCFKGFWYDILYEAKNVTDICSLTYDKILCTQDIIDDGCSKEDGRDNFDSWISGLNAMFSFLCRDHTAMLNNLLESVEPRGTCFNITTFITCVERKARVTHVTDLLYVTIDSVECNWLMISAATCGSRVSSAKCAHVSEIIGELVQIFFQEVKCDHVCAGGASPQINLLFIGFVLSLIIATHE